MSELVGGSPARADSESSANSLSISAIVRGIAWRCPYQWGPDARMVGRVSAAKTLVKVSSDAAVEIQI
jgi:hypothetical protein